MTVSHTAWFRFVSLFPVICVLSATLPLETSALADEAPESTPTAELITQLGAEEFAVREEAERRLVESGLEVVEDLRGALGAADPEVYVRVQRALRDILETDLRQRIEKFEKDPASEGEGIPSWARYREKTGSSESERKLFVQMLKAEPGLLLSADRGPESATRALRFRIQKFMQGQNTPVPGRRVMPEVGSTLALLFVSGDVSLVGQTAPTEFSWLRNWLRQNPFRKFVDDKENGTAARKLLTHWVLARTNNGNFHVDRLYDALTFKLTEALPLAVQGMKTPPYLGMSIEAVGRLGGKPYAALLVPMLDNKTVVASYTSNNKKVEIQARDVALAWLANLTDQKPTTYGLPHAEQWFKSLKKNTSTGFNSRSYRVDDEKKRDENRKRWDDWVLKNPVSKPPKDYSEIAALGPAAVPKEEKEPEEDEEWEEPEPYKGPQLAEYNDRKLLRAAREAIASGQWYQAADALGRLAEIPHEKWFQPERGVPNYREIRSEVERIILTLPDAGLAAVEAQSGATARGELDDALTASDLPAVEEVARRYFFTQAGAEATWRVATMALDSGRPFDALLQFDRLVVASRYADSFEPQLSLRRALCHARLQEYEQATRVLFELRQRYPDAVPSAGGESAHLTEADGIRNWLSAFSELSGPAASGWFTHRGNTVRDSEGAGIIPHTDTELLAPLTETQRLREAVSAVDRDRMERRLGRIPAPQPIVVGDRVIFRTATGIRAVNREGTTVWHAPQQDALWELVHMKATWSIPERPAAAKTPTRTTTTAKPEEQIGHNIVDGLQQRLLDDTLYGTLCSDGRRVFVVESDDFPCPAYVQRLRATSDGTLELETNASSGGNSLAAYDVDTGRLLWKQSGMDTVSGTEAAPIEYLGTPLVAGSSLFAMVRIGEEVVLRRLDPESGDSTREWMLQTDTPPPRHVFWRMQYPQAQKQRHARSPSYVDGTIVCLTPSNRVVAIDLRTGRLQWSWLGPKRKAPRNMRFNPWMQIAANARRDGELDHWCDASLVLDSNTVLVATPGSDQLTCLNLADGSVRWSAPRRDGLYIAGIHRDRVIVIGRVGARAFHLQDGSSAWSAEIVGWPDAAMPSGMGYLNGDRYCVPLTSGEVLVINAGTGEWIARSRSRNDVVPGNLVALDDTVWSLGLDGLRQFPSIKSRSEDLAALVKDQPDDPAALLELGATLLNGGNIAEALAPLRQAGESDDNKQQAELLLARAVRDGVPFDNTVRTRLVEELELAASSKKDLVQLHAETALGFERQNDTAQALESLLRITELSIEPEDLTGDKPLMYKESVSRSVRIDRWFQSKFARWYAASDNETRERMDARAAEAFSQAPAKAIVWFRQHAAADEQHLKVASQLEEGDRFQWELALRRAMASPAETVVASAKDQLLSAMPTVDARRAAWTKWMAGNSAEVPGAANSPWPEGTVQKTVEKRDPKKQYTQRVQFRIEQFDRSLDEPLWLQLNTTQRKWSVLDASGRTRYQLDPAKDGKTVSYSYSVNVTQAQLIGPILVVWTGMEVTAFRLTGEEGQRLWSRPVYDPQHRPWVMRFIPRRVQRAGRRAAVVFGANQPASWWAFSANTDFIALQQDQQLLAIDLSTGSVLWQRDGIPYDCDITGDRDVIVVIPPEDDEAITFSGLDGRELSRRKIPSDDEWVSLNGRQLVMWSTAIQQQSTLKCVDLVTGDEAWSRPFEAGSRIDRVRSGRVAVLDPAGEFVVVDTTTGQTRTSAKLNPAKDIEGLNVIESRGRYIVSVRVPADPNAKPNGVAVRINTSGSSAGRQRVGGQVYCLTPADGEVEWQATLPSHAVAPTVLGDVPLLACYHTRQIQKKRENGSISTTHETWLNVLNLSNGLVAHDTKLTSGTQLDQQFFPTDARVEVHTRTNIMTFRFAVSE